MDVRRLEARLLEESLADLPRRIRLAESKVLLCELEDRPAPADLIQELSYLSRIAQRDGADGSRQRLQLERLCARVEGCERSPMACRNSSSDLLAADAASDGISTAASSADLAPSPSAQLLPRPIERLSVGMQLVSISETVMRSGESLDSAEVKVLEPRTHAWVQNLGNDLEGRRICIEDEDYEIGWVSAVTRKGEWLWKEEGKDPFEDLPEFDGGKCNQARHGDG